MIDDSMRWARRQLAPVTLGLMAALIVGSLFFWFTHGAFLNSLVLTAGWTHQPWQLLTYPFAYTGIGPGGINQLVWFLMLLGLMLFTCAGVERQIGTPKYAILWVVSSVLPALLIWLGISIFVPGASRAVGSLVIESGPLLPVATITFIFCIRNKTFTLNLFGILPLTGVWIAAIIVGGLFFEFGSIAIPVGFFAIMHLALAYLYAENRLSFLPYAASGYQAAKPSKAERQRQAQFFDDVRKREKEREERERLRKLFEGSLGDDDEKRSQG